MEMERSRLRFLSWTLTAVSGALGHDEPYLTAASAYWRPVLERILGSPGRLTQKN
jgi:hypothetical protein